MQHPSSRLMRRTQIPYERPDREIAKAILQVVFFASMEHDEGRFSALSVAYTPRPMIARSAGTGFGEIGHRYSWS
jgi:hypothetical protein